LAIESLIQLEKDLERKLKKMQMQLLHDSDDELQLATQASYL